MAAGVLLLLSLTQAATAQTAVTAASSTQDAQTPSASALDGELFYQLLLGELDAEGVQLIWVESPPPGVEWDGVRDRLTRAGLTPDWKKAAPRRWPISNRSANRSTPP